MDTSRGPRRALGDGESGQVLMIAGLLLTVLLGLTALAIDTGMGYAQRAGVQNAVDQSALAAAEAMTTSGSATAAVQAAVEYAQRNGYTNGVNGVTVTVNNPPASGTHAGDPNYFAVFISEAAPRLFSRVLNQGSTVGAHATAGVTASAVLPYNFVALSTTCSKHTLLVKVGGTLTVDGGIYVNGSNSDPTDGQGNPLPCGNEQKGQPGWGDAFDVFGAGGSITAQKIMVHGGWETHNNDLVCLPAGCCGSPGPCSSSVSPLIGQPILPDPLAGLPVPKLSAYPTQHSTANSPSPLIVSSGSQTLQPGVYYGGIQLSGSANVTFAAGMYIMAGGGLSVTGGASLNAPGVTIYNTNAGGGPFSAINISTTGNVTLKATRGGPYNGLTIFQDRAATTNIILSPGNGISGLSGTIYAPGWKTGNSSLDCNIVNTSDLGMSIVEIKASGTANLQIISAQILVCGANARFKFDASGLANSTMGLVE